VMKVGKRVKVITLSTISLHVGDRWHRDVLVHHHEVFAGCCQYNKPSCGKPALTWLIGTSDRDISRCDVPWPPPVLGPVHSFLELEAVILWHARIPGLLLILCCCLSRLDVPRAPCAEPNGFSDEAGRECQEVVSRSRSTNGERRTRNEIDQREVGEERISMSESEQGVVVPCRQDRHIQPSSLPEQRTCPSQSSTHRRTDRGE